MNNTTHEVMFLTTQWTHEEWEAQYLLALSYLNFDRSFKILIFPGAMQECTWSEKQWQALSLYGLEACYHIKEQPPITSQNIDWAVARQLLLQNQHYTLHICHWKNRKHFEHWLPIVSKEDSLILFGNNCQHDALWVSQHWPNNKQCVVNIAEHPHINNNTQDDFDQQQWIKLIIQSPATLAWT